jgi:hypothetical protein
MVYDQSSAIGASLDIDPLIFDNTRRLPLLAHRVISLRRGIWSLSAHSGL